MVKRTCFVIAFFFLATANVAFAQALLKVVGGTSLDFGKIYKGEQIERKLKLKNTGNDTLVLGAIDVSCGCTGTALSDNRIGPGREGTLVIKFNSKNFTGPVHKTVTINSNSHEAARTPIEFVVNVVEEISLTPTQLWFKEAQVGKESSLTLSIKNDGLDTLRITGFRTTLTEFSLVVPTSPIPPGTKVDMVATLKPKQASPILTDRVILETSNPRQPDVAIPLYGNVKP